MDWNHVRSVSDTRTREVRGPYISEKDHVEYSPWADRERSNDAGGRYIQQAPLSDLFGNRWRHDAFDGLRQAHERGALHKERLKARDAPSSSHGAPPRSDFGGPHEAASRSIYVLQRPIRSSNPPRPSLNDDSYKQSPPKGSSGYSGPSQEYEMSDSEESDSEDVDSSYDMRRAEPSYNTPPRDTNKYSSSSSRKMDISDLLCSDESGSRRPEPYRTRHDQSWDSSRNSSPGVRYGTETTNSSRTLSSRHDGYETRETTQTRSTYNSDAVQSPASPDTRPSGRRYASFPHHEAYDSSSRTPTPEPSYDHMDDYSEYSSPSPTNPSTYIPHYDHHYLPSPEPVDNSRLPSPPYHSRFSSDHHSNLHTHYRSQEPNNLKRPLTSSRSRSPRRPACGPSRDASASPLNEYNDIYDRPTGRPVVVYDSTMATSVERPRPVPVSANFRPPNYRPAHLFRVLRRGLNHPDDKSTPDSTPAAPVHKDQSSSGKLPRAPSVSPAPTSNKQPLIISPGECNSPSRPSDPPPPAREARATTPPRAQLREPTPPAPLPVSQPSTLNTPTPELPRPDGVFLQYRHPFILDPNAPHITPAVSNYYRPHCATNSAPPPKSTAKPIDSSDKKTAKKTPKRTPGEFTCEFCQKMFTRNFDLMRHQKTIHQDPQGVDVNAQTCPDCLNYFSRKDAYVRHMEKRPGSCFKASNFRGNAQLKAQAPEIEPVQAIINLKTKAK